MSIIKWKASLACVILFSFLAIGIGAAPVQAYTTYELTMHGSLGYPDFSVYYIDYDGDAKMSEDEMLFGGAIFPSPPTGSQGIYLPFFSSLFLQATTVPAYGPGEGSVFTDGSGGSQFVPPYWIFAGNGQTAYVPEYVWTQTEIETALPPSALLLGSGLIPLAWARRKKRLGK